MAGYTDQAKKMGQEALDTMKSVGRKALNVAENLTGIREAGTIHKDIQGSLNRGMNFYHEDDHK